MKKIILFILLSSVFQQVISQNKVKSTFRSPLDIPLFLSGCFGELRANHFHTGLDIKTQGVTGLKVFAVEEGYISRMQKSQYGYGYVLYVNHPNGLTTVYAHLDKFNFNLEKYYQEQQYSKQLEYLNLEHLPDTLFKLKKGDVIGYSGNTGHSGGPHLHFEVRDTKTEQALNPWKYGFAIEDNIAPNLLHLKVYELSEDSTRLSENLATKKYDLVGGGINYQIKNNTTISVSDLTGFAIHSIDITNGSGNQCGIFSAELYKNDTLYFKQEMNAIDFAFNRFINTHMDFLAYKEHKNSYHKSFIPGNNKLGIYPVKINDGKIKLGRGEKAKMKYVIKDINGNTSILNFEIINDGLFETKIPAPCPLIFYWKNENTFETNEIKLKFPKESLYENQCFNYVQEPKKTGMIGPTHLICNYSIPVQEHYEIALRVDSIPDSLQNKLVAVFIGEKGGISSEGGIFINGWINFKTRSFGRYSVMIDSIAPLITPDNISEGKDMSTNTEIRFSVADNLSGIKQYNAYIDEKWVLMHYDGRKGKMRIYFSEEKIARGEHQLRVELTDERGNKRTYSAKFVR